MQFELHVCEFIVYSGIICIYVCWCMQPGDFVTMTNVHAMVHKSTDTALVNQVATMVELCIHGKGVEKFGRGLTVVDDSLPAVQHLKLLLEECVGDRDVGSDEERLADDDLNNDEVEVLR